MICFRIMSVVSVMRRAESDPEMAKCFHPKSLRGVGLLEVRYHTHFSQLGSSITFHFKFLSKSTICYFEQLFQLGDDAVSCHESEEYVTGNGKSRLECTATGKLNIQWLYRLAILYRKSANDLPNCTQSA